MKNRDRFAIRIWEHGPFTDGIPGRGSGASGRTPMESNRTLEAGDAISAKSLPSGNPGVAADSNVFVVI